MVVVEDHLKTEVSKEKEYKLEFAEGYLKSQELFIIVENADTS